MEYNPQIKALREARGMTQRGLAEKLNVSPAAVAQWELNNTVPSLNNLFALANLFDCSLDTICGRDGPGQTSA